MREKDVAWKAPSRQIRVSSSISEGVQRTTLRPFASPEALWSRAPVAGRRRDDQRAPLVVRERLERVPFGRRALMDMAAEHELRARVRERRAEPSRDA